MPKTTLKMIFKAKQMSKETKTPRITKESGKYKNGLE